MKNFTLIILFLGISFAASSQYKRKTVFHPEWYVSTSLGTNLYIAEGFGDYTIQQALGLVGRASIGYNFTPIVGIRGTVGFNSNSWPDKNNSNEIIKFNAENLSSDITINLVNWLNGYNYRRKFDLSIFGGVGVGHRDKAMFLADYFTQILRGGIQVDYSLSPILKLNFIGDINFVNDNYNGYIGTKVPFDMYPVLSVGLTYRIPTNRVLFQTHKYNYFK